MSWESFSLDRIFMNSSTEFDEPDLNRPWIHLSTSSSSSFEYVEFSLISLNCWLFVFVFIWGELRPNNNLQNQFRKLVQK